MITPGIIQQLSHVSLSTPDLPVTVAFYTRLLGCRLVHEFKNEEGFTYGVFLHAGRGTFLEFFHSDHSPRQGGCFRHLCFQVDSIQRVADRMRASGLRTEVKRSRSDRTLQCWISDPHGTVIEFHQHDEESSLFALTGSPPPPVDDTLHS